MTSSEARGERRYGGQSAAERRADRRQRLHDAGLELFGTQGFRVTTVTDLCRAAGVAPLHFYEEFPGREALLEDVYDEIMHSTRVEVEAAIASVPVGDIEARTRVGLSAFCHAMLMDPRRARVQCIEIVGVSPALELRRHEGLLRWAGLVADSYLGAGTSLGLAVAEELEAPEHANSGTDGLNGLRSMVVALVGGVDAALVDWLLQERPPPISSVVDAMGDLFIATAHYLDGRLD